MSFEIRLIEREEKARLKEIFSFYLKELNMSCDVESVYPFFDSYWIDDDRWAYFILNDKVIVGFAFINIWSPSGKVIDRAVAEFYVRPKYCGKNIGKCAFTRLLRLYQGIWELSVMKENKTGISFWEKTLLALDIPMLERLERERKVIFWLSNIIRNCISYNVTNEKIFYGIETSYN